MTYLKRAHLSLLCMIMIGCTGFPPAPVKDEITPGGGKAEMSTNAVVDKFPKCARYSWKNRGVAGIGYIRGVALAYHEAFCRKDKSPPLGGKFDALSLYGKPATLRATYTLMIGLGMRESSGNYCCGVDTTNPASFTAESAEAGPFQVSYDSRMNPDGETVNAERAAIIKKWSDLPIKNCHTAVWKEGVGECSSFEGVGKEGPGRLFQYSMKICPAFAAEYTAQGMRTRMTHWGPLKRKEAEYRDDCEAMLAEVEKVGCE